MSGRTGARRMKATARHPGVTDSEGSVRVYFHTFGCKANQYDTERMRQELRARRFDPAGDWEEADVCVLNTCTVTSRADAEARRIARKIKRQNPTARVVVAGCSAALRGADYRTMPEVADVVGGHDPVAVAVAVEHAAERASSARSSPARSSTKESAVKGAPANGSSDGRSDLVQIGLDRPLDRVHEEPVGAEILRRREGGTRGWLKIQDGCDRKCSFCATRLARGSSRSRPPAAIVREAKSLARHHPELVLTGIHIGHYGRDLGAGRMVLSALLALLLESVPDVRFRLGSIEATEVDDLVLDLMATSCGRVAPHLHMPLQSGADPVLRRMRRWHTRETYRARALEIVERIGDMALGADVITGFPGETEADHCETVRLVEELPYTHVHTFPFSPREGTVAAALKDEMPVPQRIAGERSREIRRIVRRKGDAYAMRRAREARRVRVVLEGEGGQALTGDYLRVPVAGPDNERNHRPDRERDGEADREQGDERDRRRLHDGRLGLDGDDVVVRLSPSDPCRSP